MSPMRWVTGSLLVAALLMAAALPAVAQSPSVAPSIAPSAAPSSAPVDPVVAACAGFVEVSALSAAFGQEATFQGGGRFEGFPGMPPEVSCGYRLADGTSFGLTSHWDITLPDGQSAAIKWGPDNGGAEIPGLPAPAYGTTFPDGRSGVAWTPVMGPLLTQVLDVEGSLPDGSPSSLEVLTTFAMASAGTATPLGLDPVCTGLLDVPAVSSQGFDPGDGHRVCGYDLGDGRAVRLEVGDRSKGDLPGCCTRVPELGKGAFAQQSGRGKRAPWRIEWIITPGDPAVVGQIENSPAAANRLSKADLIALAKEVTP